jgi:hypothetical protein
MLSYWHVRSYSQNFWPLTWRAAAALAQHKLP